MEIDKVERRLKKISTVFDAFKEDGKISSIEKDLLLGYIRDLYELVLDSEAKVIESPTILPPKPKIQEIVESAPKFKEVIHEPIVENISPVHFEQRTQPVISKEEKLVALEHQNQMFSTPTIDLSFKSSNTEPIAVVAEKKEEPITAEPITVDFNHPMEKLFIISKAVDLSDKLSMSRIDDIHKAMGINERLFNQNELFGGNGALFSETLTRLNQFASFDEAKEYLKNGVAKENKWDSETKWAKAQQFVKLVYRRYN
ncbi:MAG TPA: hypothetical protein PLY70_19900 [Saprospiraceae bacterium]|nr:hypothetical protein [Saprospiraceae bacterium]HPN72170.1 hypothetical protein [Saprospiraceae bacterium]